MALLLYRSVFYHIGRTAGHWVRSSLAQQGLAQREVGGFHDWPARVVVTSPEVASLFGFAFVRHPVAWLKSRWTHAMQFGWSRDDAVSTDIRAIRFADFIERMLARHPEGPASAAFGPFLEACQFVGRQESLKDDLCRALEQAGETFDPSLMSPERIGGVEIDADLAAAAKAPHSLLSAVMAADAKFCTRFGYDEVPTGIADKSRLPKHRLSDVSIAISVLKTSLEPAIYESLVEAKFRSPSIAEGSDGVQMITWGAPGSMVDGHAWRKILDSLDLANKDLLFVEPADWSPIFHVLSRAPRSIRVLLTTQSPHDYRLVEALENKDQPIALVTSYAETLHDTDGFDVVLMTNGLEGVRLLTDQLLRLSMLVRPGGFLALSFGAVDLLPDLPILLTPSADHGIFGDSSISFANEKAVEHLLRSFGLPTIVSRIRHPLGPPAADSLVGAAVMAMGDAAHASHSPFSRLFVVAQASAARTEAEIAQRDALIRGAQSLWLEPVPPEMLGRLAEMDMAVAESQAESERWRAATADRESALLRTIEEREQIGAELKTRTQELVNIRVDLRDRTIWLERTLAEIEELKARIAALEAAAHAPPNAAARSEDSA